MLKSLVPLCGALALCACGGHAQNPYPQSAQAAFEASCPADGDGVCSCTWEQITRSMTYEEYENALARFRETGLMEPKITRARTHCIEHRQT